MIMKWLLRGLLLWLPFVVQAKDGQVLAHLLHQQAMRATFIQTVYDQRHHLVHTARGKIAIAQPDKFRWEVNHPAPEIIVANGQQLWIYDPDLAEMTIRPLDQTLQDAPLFLLHAHQLDRHFNITMKRAGNMQWFLLVPKQADSLFRQMQLGFLQNKLVKFYLHDHLGQTTLIHFDQVRYMQHLPESLFTLRVPANVDIIDAMPKP